MVDPLWVFAAVVRHKKHQCGVGYPRTPHRIKQPSHSSIHGLHSRVKLWPVPADIMDIQIQ